MRAASDTRRRPHFLKSRSIFELLIIIFLRRLFLCGLLLFRYCAKSFMSQDRLKDILVILKSFSQLFGTIFLKMILRSQSALRVGSLLVGLVAGMVTMSTVSAMTYTPNSEIGYPAGLIPECPGIMKNATISSKMLPLLQVVHHKLDEKGQTVRIPMPITKAAKIVARDKSIDFKNKKTVFYAVGFIDSSVFPHSQAVGDSYAKLGYNVFLTETFALLTYIYPKSARLSRTIGKKLGEFLVKLTVQQGLAAENLELVGISLGAHIMSYAAKHLYAVTGKKPSRITGLDPAGPCFRSLPPQYRLNPSDGERVDVIHTNIDGFGIAEPLGHVDFYVNGGEYQPGDILYIPCLIICSHIKAIIYWWQALEHPSKFIGVKCNSVQEARVAGCYNNTETNYLGLRTNFSETGIFYLSTNYAFPYYRGKTGLKPENEIYTSLIRQINSDEDFVV